MQYYEGLAIPRKDSSSRKAATRVMHVQARVFCIRASKLDCENISCDACLFHEDKNSVKFNKWYSEMQDTFEKRHTATVH